jgi:hypothetical protein
MGGTKGNRNMAKKRPIAKKPAKPGKSAKPTKAAAKPSSKDSSGAAVVCFTLRDTGATALRFHSEHDQRERARGTAMALANSPDVADVFVLTGVELFRGHSQP